jgi:hypothetical protein
LHDVDTRNLFGNSLCVFVYANNLIT